MVVCFDLLDPKFLMRAGRLKKGASEDEDQKQSAVITRGYFDRGKEEQNKENFEGAIDIFTHKDSRRRGSVEFIYAAMRNMEHFGVHR